MKARPARRRIGLVVGIGLLLSGCSGTVPAPSTPEATAAPQPGTATAAPTVTATPAPTVTPSPAPTSTGSATPSPASGRTAVGTLTLSGTAIGDRPLGGTPLSRLEPDLVVRLGKPEVGRPELCRLAGQRNQFALVDHRFGGLTVRYARRGGADLAIGWEVELDRVPDGLLLADRLEWRPAFADLRAADGVAVATGSGLTVARLIGRALSYSGRAGADRPDTVTGGPDLVCR